MELLVAMGFPARLAQQALKLCDHDPQRATDMLLNNPPPLPDETEPTSGAAPFSSPVEVDEDPLKELRLMGFEESSARGALVAASGSLDLAINLLIDEAGASTASMSGGVVEVRWDDLRNHKGTVAAASSHVEEEELEPPEPPKKRAKQSNRVRPSSAECATASHGRQDPPDAPSDAPCDSAASTLPSLAQGLCFGPSAFGRIERARPSGGWLELEQKEVARMVVASVPSARHLRGQRGELKVTQMLAGIHKQGLWTFGNASSPVNREVWPAFRFIVSEMSKLEPLHPKRVNIFTALVKACEDCQQVQAREILRIYGDLTSQTETFEQQLKYSLIRQKEVALNHFITQQHTGCDLDHTQVQPHQQRVHLFSGYVSQIGDSFGLDGLDAAKSDKFLPRVLEELERKKTLKSKRRFLQALVREMSVTDINNQSVDADRLINRSGIFQWVQANLSVEAAHRIFYDEDRAEEFKGQDPEKPEPANQYQPFLSGRMLVEMLMHARFLVSENDPGWNGPR
ncbi:unnamed protein product [Durusdinium trenchii]|uniref:UBA domain-containing protein n=1 Tax=Durusdinium trenchii TaxID=1381693 RepID=A0ABP0M2N3_9DINO